LVVHRLSGCAYVPCQVGASPLALRVKKQERKQSCLESRPEDRQDRQRLRPHAETLADLVRLVRTSFSVNRTRRWLSRSLARDNRSHLPFAGRSQRATPLPGP